MARQRSPKRKKALKLWIDSGRTMPLIELGERVGVSYAQIRKWKFEDKWEEEPDKRSRGGQPGNKNAVGNSGGGAPIGNKNGANLFRKFLPDDPDYIEILDKVRDMDPLDMIWHGVEASFATLIRMERIMYVENKQEMIKEIKKRKSEVHENGEGVLESVETEIEYEFQWSWDRYMTYVKAQTATLAELRGGIKSFLSLAPEHDERRAKLDLMQVQAEKTKAEIESLKGGGKNSEAEDWVAALNKATEKRKAQVKSNE